MLLTRKNIKKRNLLNGFDEGRRDEDEEERIKLIRDNVIQLCYSIKNKIN